MKLIANPLPRAESLRNKLFHSTTYFSYISQIVVDTTLQLSSVQSDKSVRGRATVL